MGRKESENGGKRKADIPRYTVLLTGLPVSDLGCEGGRLDFRHPSPGSLRSTHLSPSRSLRTSQLEKSRGVGGHRPPCSQSCRAPAGALLMTLCGWTPASLHPCSGFYASTSGPPRLSMVLARISQRLAPWSVQEALLVSSESF